MLVILLAIVKWITVYIYGISMGFPADTSCKEPDRQS